MAMRFMRAKLYSTRFRAALQVGAGGRLLHDAPSCIVPQHGSGEEQGVDAVEHASVAGEKRSGIFDSSTALDERFDQIAELRGDIQRDREQNNRSHRGLL